MLVSIVTCRVCTWMQHACWWWCNDEVIAWKEFWDPVHVLGGPGQCKFPFLAMGARSVTSSKLSQQQLCLPSFLLDFCKQNELKVSGCVLKKKGMTRLNLDMFWEPIGITVLISRLFIFAISWAVVNSWVLPRLFNVNLHQKARAENFVLIQWKHYSKNNYDFKAAKKNQVLFSL